MNLNDLVDAFLNPAILFFGLGLAATLFRSDLELPPAIAKALSLFLLFAIGLKGGVALHKSGLGLEVFTTLGAAMAASVIVPVWTFFALRRALGAIDAAAVAATYGSVSAVTFITAAAFLTEHDIAFSGARPALCHGRTQSGGLVAPGPGCVSKRLGVFTPGQLAHRRAGRTGTRRGHHALC